MTTPATAPHAGLDTVMPKDPLGWFDRLLIKIAIAKAIARGHCTAGLAQEAEEAFLSLNRAADTRQ